MPELGGSLIQFAIGERGPAFGDVQAGILVAVVAGRKFAALLHFGCPLVLVAGPRQSQPELIVGFAALWVEPRRFLQFYDCLSQISILQNCLAERQVGPREARGESDYLSQLL